MENKFNLPTVKEIRERLNLIPEGLWKKCLNCHTSFYFRKMGKLKICPNCDYGFRLGALKRAEVTFDEFKQFNSELSTPIDDGVDSLYKDKLRKAKEETGINESVITGRAKIGDFSTLFGIMDARFIMGSLGKMTGEKITRLFEKALEEKLPVILFSASGGARMQEGIESLMQMAKISDAIARHSKAGLLYVSVLTDPTTGGVTASFAMQGDIIISEPHTLIGFAGRRVIEKTIQQIPPDDFQQSETLLKNGFLDDVVKRNELKKYLLNILKLHSNVSGGLS